MHVKGVYMSGIFGIMSDRAFVQDSSSLSNLHHADNIGPIFLLSLCTRNPHGRLHEPNLPYPFLGPPHDFDSSFA